MKRIAIILLVAASVVVTSCQKRIDDDMNVTDMSLSVNPTIFGQKATGENPQTVQQSIDASAKIVADAKAARSGVDTRTEESSQTKSAWYSGDQFGFFLSVRQDGKQGPISFTGNTYNSMTYDNIVHTYNGTKFTIVGNMYYPYRRAVVDLYGIYPLDAELGKDAAGNAGGSKRDKSSESAYPWNVFADQTSATGRGNKNGAGNTTTGSKFNIEQGDLLFAQTLGAVPNSDGTPQNMTFKHMMTKIRIKLLVPTEFNGKALSTTEPIGGIKILNTYLESLVDFRADSVIAKRAEFTTPIAIRAAGSLAPEEGVTGFYYFFEGVAVPQVIENGTNFIRAQVNYEDGSSSAFVLRLGDKDLMLLKGKEHTFNVVFDLKLGLRLNGSSIKDWVEGSGGGGLITENDALPAANSFVVGPGDMAIIDCTIAGNDISGVSPYTVALKKPDTGVKSVRLLWQTKSGHTTNGPLIISSVDDTKLTGVKVQTNAAATGGGNAVLAAYDGVNGAGNILWSWHIWVTPEKIGLTTYGDKFVTANGIGNAIMDRNLGAVGAIQAAGNVKTGGLLYQWGRKDPFTGAATGILNSNSALAVYDLAGAAVAASTGSAIAGDGSFKFLASDVDNIEGSIKNPMTFYNSNASGGWTNPLVEDLWTRYGTLKSVFDPCPSGYRVAGKGSWDDLGTEAGQYGTMSGSDNTKGYTFGELGGSPWYPLCGTREWNNGAPVRAANSSLVFTSIDKSTFHMTGTTVSPNYEEGRSFGFSVRCVQNNNEEEHLTVIGSGDVQGVGGSTTIKVYVNKGSAWSASVSGVGFTLNPSSGIGNGTITVSATSTTVSRRATINITAAAGALLRTVTVEQYPQTTIVGGVEWCNFNLDGVAGQATAVRLAMRPQDYGKFFKWGDNWVYQRETSDTDGVKGTNTGNASTSPTNSNTGGVGNDYIQGLSGGLASGDPCQLLGANFRTPTRTQFQLLAAAGSLLGTYGGVNGYFFGPKAAQCTDELLQNSCIFIPAAGYRGYNDGALINVASEGLYWASSLSVSSTNSYRLNLTDNIVDVNTTSFRGEGFSVRCVKTPPLPAATVTIDGTEWTTTNLTGVAGQSEDVALAPYPQDYGTFFKWGDTWSYARPTSTTDGDWTSFTSGASSTPAATSTANLGYDYVDLAGGRASGDPCKKLGAYRTPTREQFQTLVASGVSTWTTYQGVNGYFFGLNAELCNNNSLKPGCVFLPAAGYRAYNDGSLSNDGNGGYYWSSSVRDDALGHSLGFSNSNVDTDNNGSRGNGSSVRCIKE